MHINNLILGGILTTLVDALPPSKTSKPTATTLNGTYHGRYNAHYNEDEFLGMPYAQPPLDDLRFRAPESLNTTWNGTRSATDYSPICVGYGSDSNTFQSSEDCLTINVVRPAGVPSEPLPVMVWLYGGGFYEGGTQDHRYNLSRIVEKSVEANKPVMAISLNYRLSAFGFLWSSEVRESNGTANVGLRDQRLALHWIQENIAGFGGDPRKVTLWGESAGAISIGRHLTAYGGRDDHLFRAAILESGGPLERWPYATPDPKAYSQELYNNLTRSTGCDDKTREERGKRSLSSSSSSLECLRSLPFSDLNAALNITDTWIAGTGLGPWLSVIDGDFLQDHQSSQMDSGRFVKIPILYGTNTDEGTAIAPTGIDTDEQLRAAIAEGGPDDDTIDAVLTLYPDVPAGGIPAANHEPLSADQQEPYGKQWKRAATFFGDMVEHYPRRAATQAYAKANQTVYSYRFNVKPQGVDADTIGVTHFQEVAWVFNNVDGAGYGDVNPMGGIEAYEEVSTLMSRMWVSFAHDLDPNHHGLEGYPTWPRYQGVVGDNFVFDANVTSYVERDDWRVEGMEFIAANALAQWKF